MITIRPAQLDSFRIQTAQEFQRGLIESIRTHFSRPFVLQGEPCVRATVEYGIERARSYGYRTRRELHLYVTIMYMLGSNFDRDPLLPAFQSALENRPLDVRKVPIDRIADSALEHVAAMTGPNKVALFRALKTMRSSIPKLRHSQPWTELTDSMLRILQSIHPRKYQLVGDDCARHAVERSIAEAREHDLVDQASVRLLALGNFMLGTRFLDDPQWSQFRRFFIGVSFDEQRVAGERAFARLEAIVDHFLQPTGIFGHV